MMIYCCDNCGFLFSRRGEICTCPSCEMSRIRPATEREAEELRRLLQESIRYGEEYVR